MVSSVYYSSTAFGLFVPLAVLYSFIAKLLIRPTEQQLPPPPSQQPLPARIAIVTGSNTGVGYETAQALVNYGYVVILACRSRDKGLAAVEAIGKATTGSGGKPLFVHPLDLSDFDSIRAFCKYVSEQYPTIHVLVNNAGRNTSGKNGDLDLLFQSNFLGHFLLTSLLMDKMSADARIVNLSSVMHHFCGSCDVDSADFWKNVARYETPPTATYNLSKLAAILFSLELNRRYPQLCSMAVNPGAV